MESYMQSVYQENASVKCIRLRRIAAGGVKQVKIGQLWMKGQPWIERNKNRKYLSVLLPLLLLLLTVFFCWLFCLRFGVFGSKIDWISQHSVIPDYFRQQFYDTGNFFPEFAANLGAGQIFVVILLRTLQSGHFSFLSSAFCKNVRLYDGGAVRLSGVFCHSYVYLAAKRAI